MLKVFSQSLGCPKNLVDTEHVLGSLGNIVMVEDSEEADILFINTCAFIESAVQESVQTIVELVSEVDEDVFVIVCGCLVGRFPTEELSEELPEVNLWLDTETIDVWGELSAKAIQEYFDVELVKKELLVEFEPPKGLENHPLVLPPVQDRKILLPPKGRMLSTGPSYAWLKVGEGCKHNCSFCTIPSIRGSYRSYPCEGLALEAKYLVEEQGVKELILVAQDVSAWGSDLPEKDLRPLLDKLFALNGLERLRLMYLYPAGMTKNLLQYLQGAGSAFVPYFDIPLQHSHTDILGQMGRPFAQNPEIVVDRIREYFPEAAIRTTFIVGFPGETDEHFKDLTRFVHKSRFHQMGVFAYEKEDGTVAASMENQIPDEIKQERRNQLMELQAEISEEILESYAGQRLPVLLDSVHPEWPGLYVGRTWFQAPNVDGITYVSSPPDGPLLKAGSLVEADITETKEYDLVALV